MNTFTKDLSVGSWGKDVMALQNFLMFNGYETFIPTGLFGNKTFNAVREFQKDNRITPVSGYVGPKTRGIINSNQYTKSRITLYNYCRSVLNTDVTPEDIVPDEYDCSDTICTILKKAGYDIGNYPLTTDLYNVLVKHVWFRRAYGHLPGDIIISPTGYGSGVIPNGHVGIMGIGDIIMSNSSSNGKFSENYSLPQWISKYEDKGGYPVLFFRLIK